jgi:predicted nucleotidyltransferase component of viral defense system
MTRIMDVLDLVVDKLRKDNPYGLVLKGGTSLAIHHTPKHRESEDLDFDVDIKKKGQAEEIALSIEAILQELMGSGIITKYRVTKKGMAATDRYHMNLIIETYKPFQTKMDFDFVNISQNLEYEGKLGFYTKERMFVAKLMTFVSRRELKDIYDISYLLKVVEPGSFPEAEKLAILIEKAVNTANNGELVASYRKTLRNLDVRFKNLSEGKVSDFMNSTIRQLRAFRNELMKR